MPVARFTSVQLARFVDLTPHGGIADASASPAHALRCGCDARAAGTDPARLEGWVFLLLGYHEREEDAARALATRSRLVPWWDGAEETWGAVLAPFRTFGEANHLSTAAPGPLFAELHPAPPTDQPMVAVTSSGWVQGAGFDLARVQRFGAGVAAVRAGMTNTPGLCSQQTFFFPGVFTHDPVTVTTWQSFDAMRQFAYGPGSHRHKLDQHRASPDADRTSFTRYAVRAEQGSWYGRRLTGAG